MHINSIRTGGCKAIDYLKIATAAFGGLAAGPALEAPPSEPWLQAPREVHLASSLPQDRVELAWLVPERGDPSRPAMVFDTGGHRAPTGHFAIRRDNWKLIAMADADDAPGSRMLFDLASDPGEQVDLIDRHPQTAAKLDRLLQRIKNCGSRRVMRLDATGPGD